MTTTGPDGHVRDRPDAVVTLVPGTWAGRAAWVRADSGLSRALTAAGCLVVPFEWSHSNCYRARMRAARRLAEQLQDQIRENPDARQWVVAHSHGGNIAVHAIRHLRNSGADAARVSTVTLATPFIHARRRVVSGWWPVFVLALFGFFVIAWAGSALAAGPHWRDWPVFGFGVLIASDTLLCIAGACMHPGFIRPGYRSRLIASVHSPAVEPDNLFVVRAAGDEASVSLATGQFLGWISGLLNRRLTNLWLWAVIILVSEASVLAALTRIASPGLAVSVILYAFVASGLLAVGVVSVMLAAALPFGWDGPFVSVFAACSAEAAPPGQATILQLEPFAEAQNRGLAHSGLYQSKPVISTITTLVGGSAPTRAPVEPPGSLEGQSA
jgi:Lipase (class 3)